MSRVSREMIENCAKNLMFQLSEGQAEILSEEFDTLYSQLEFLADIPGVDSAEPMTFPFRRHLRDCDLRPDVPEAPLGAEKALANSHSTIGDQIKVPKVVAHGVIDHTEDEGGEE
ncbi:MAG TPA: hypothetical protein DEA32_02675 [Firmicutes bacterium]|nr:hypothetical protein [Bacillota bacterium]